MPFPAALHIPTRALAVNSPKAHAGSADNRITHKSIGKAASVAQRQQGQRSAQPEVTGGRPRPVVHPGREPVVPSTREPEGTGQQTPLQSAPEAPHTETEPRNDTEGAAVVADDGSVGDSPDMLYEAMHQRKRKQLLSECARLQVFDFQILAMPRWPENFALTQARRSRDQWVFAMSVMAVVFLGGVANLIPAWLAGPAFGAFILIGSLAVPAIRRWATSRASYGELIAERRQLLRAARKHIAHLEGSSGLAWLCQPLADYHPTLRQSRFQSLFNLSRTGNLASYIRSRAHVRLYLMFLLEAEKAYGLMESRYLEMQLRADEEKESVQTDKGEASPGEPDLDS